jgi:ubiquinone/menaquinone biosynthesis C-methylase UbiE
LGNGRDLKLISDSTVDFLFSYLVLQHVPHVQIVLNYIKETARVLKPCGVAFLQLRTHRSIWEWLRWVTSPIIWRVKQIITKKENFNLDKNLYLNCDVWRGCSVSISAIKKTAASVGLQIELIEEIGTQYTFIKLKKIVISPGQNMI